MAIRPTGTIPTPLFTCSFCEETTDEATAGVMHYAACLAPKLHPLCVHCFEVISRTSKDNESCPLCSRDVSEIKSLRELKAIVAQKHVIEKKIVKETNQVYQVFLPLALESVKAKYPKGVIRELDKAFLALESVKKTQETLGDFIIDPDLIVRHQEAITAAKQAATENKFEEAEKILKSLLPEQTSSTAAHGYFSAAVSVASTLFGMVFSKN